MHQDCGTIGFGVFGRITGNTEVSKPARNVRIADNTSLSPQSACMPLMCTVAGRLRTGSFDNFHRVLNERQIALQPALNMCLTPRKACRVLSSFSISENRTCPSP